MKYAVYKNAEVFYFGHNVQDALRAMDDNAGSNMIRTTSLAEILPALNPTILKGKILSQDEIVAMWKGSGQPETQPEEITESDIKTKLTMEQQIDDVFDRFSAVVDKAAEAFDGWRKGEIGRTFEAKLPDLKLASRGTRMLAKEILSEARKGAKEALVEFKKGLNSK